MNSSRPYLIRAIHEWIVDNFMTPYLLVDIEGEGVDVPRQHGQNGKIVLNVSPQAVDGLTLSTILPFWPCWRGTSTPSISTSTSRYGVMKLSTIHS